MKITDIKVLKEGTLSIDVPNEDWLQEKIDYAKSKGRNSYGVPYMGSTTASVRGTPPRVRVLRLASLPGMRNEQTNVRRDDLKWLMDYMDKNKRLPPANDPNEEYLPYIMVAYNGEAWVNEGNHRIMAAYRLNWPDMPIEIRYFDGGERVRDGAMYPGKIGLGEVDVPQRESVTEDDSESIQEALENWMEMYSTPQDIQAILSSSESEPFKKPPNIQWLYRAIVPKDRDINSIKSTGQVVAFATDMQGAINFIRTLEIQDDWVIIRKPFNPSDFLLDFTGMYEAVAQGAHSDRYVKEHEVWMKPTLKYTSAKKNEIVYSSKEDYNENQVYPGEVDVPKSESMTEIFEPGKQNWKWRRQSSDEAFASFVVGDREYQWHAFNSDANTTKWEIQFRLMRAPTDPDGLDLFGQTGTGNSAQVLSTAVDITRAFLQAYGLDKVEEITFNAKEDSRIDLYAKMIKRLLPTWELINRKSRSHGMQFTLTDPRAYDKPENKITEIDRMASDEYSGGKKSLRVGKSQKQIKKLPGNNAFMYSTEENQFETGIIIKLWDSENTSPKPVQMKDEDGEEFAWRLRDWERAQGEDVPGALVGKLVLEDAEEFPLKGAVQVDTITVDEDYRGQGIAKSMYGVALSILKKPLIAGSGQTQGGRRNWLSLASTPGVEIKGYVIINQARFDNPEWADKDIDVIMGQLGGQYIGPSKPAGVHYFAFDVVPGSGELAPAVKTELSKIYDGHGAETGLYAVWHGAVSEDLTEAESTGWTALEVVESILGKDRVTADEDELVQGMYYVYESNSPPAFEDTEELGQTGGAIRLHDLEATDPKAIAEAAHEACHAYAHSKSTSGMLYTNEKIINNLAEIWLKKNLSGTALHFALEHILGSKLHYGPDHMPRSVAEARTNPEQNVKPASGMKELQAVAKTLGDIKNWAISMTSEPKLGINPQVGISEDTPKGIYFYPLDYALGMIQRRQPLPWGNNLPYIQLFQYDRSGEMTKDTQVDGAKLKQAVGQYCSAEVIQSAIDEPEYDGTPYWFIYDCLSRLGKTDETNIVRWNKVLRDLGFTSVYDDGHGWIAYNEPTQGVVLDPRVIKQLKTIDNKKESGVITPALIEKTLFDNLDVELASSRAWQAYDPDGSKLKQLCKEWAQSDDFKPWFGKDASALWDEDQKLMGLIGYYRRTVGREINSQAFDWYRAQQAQKTESITEIDAGTVTNLFAAFPTISKIIVYNALNKARQEKNETAQMIDVLTKVVTGKSVTPDEYKLAHEQFKDLLQYGIKAIVPAVSGGVLAGLSAVYKKELIELIKNKGPAAIVDMLQNKNIDIVKTLYGNFLGKHTTDFYVSPKKTTESVVNEGGWASTETQNTVITPRIVAEIVHILDGFEASYNAWQAGNELDTEIKIGKPKGSGTYYRRDLEQDPDREYGDVDVECFVHSRKGSGSAQRVTEYRRAIKDYCAQSPDFSTDNGTNVIMRTTAGPVQVDLIYTFHEHADWSRVLSPEYRVKGVISTSLTSSIAEALNLSFSSQGIQVKIRNNQPVSFRQSKDTELRTVSINPDNWAQDIYSLYYYLSHGEKPAEMPRDLQAHGGLKDEQRLSDIVLSIKALASGLEEANLLAHGALIDIQDKKDLIRRVAQIYSAKLEAAENSSKFDKASTPAAVEKAKKTKLMLAKYRNEVTKLLLN